MSKVSTISKSEPREKAVEARPLGRRSRALSPFEEMERMFEDFGITPRGWLRPLRWDLPAWGEMTSELEARTPLVDVIDRDEEVLVKAELPGVEKKDLDITLANQSLTIRATTRHQKEEEVEGEYHRSEISRGEFIRTLTLPAEVDGDKAHAKFENGILELNLPKVESVKRRTIAVS